MSPAVFAGKVMVRAAVTPPDSSEGGLIIDVCMRRVDRNDEKNQEDLSHDHYLTGLTFLDHTE